MTAKWPYQHDFRDFAAIAPTGSTCRNHRL